MTLAMTDLQVNLMVFLLATFLGLELVRHVSRLLHTPLMALTNAISSVSIVAALIVLANPKDDLVLVLATVAVALVFTNIVSGFAHCSRLPSAVRTNAPFRVPTSTLTVLMPRS